MSKCPLCPFTTDDPQAFNAHMSAAHPPAPQCPSCGFALPEPANTLLGSGTPDYNTEELDAIDDALIGLENGFHSGLEAIDRARAKVQAVKSAAIARAEEDEALLRAQFPESKTVDPNNPGGGDPGGQAA